MLKLKIRTRSGEYHAELDDSDLSNAVWFSATPFTTQVNELGCSLYFEMPLDVPENGERQTKFEVGDIAWWPGVGALCIFYGPTPLSGEDGKPVTEVLKVMPAELKAAVDEGRRQYLESLGERAKGARESADALEHGSASRNAVARNDIAF